MEDLNQSAGVDEGDMQRDRSRSPRELRGQRIMQYVRTRSQQQQVLPGRARGRLSSRLSGRRRLRIIEPAGTAFRGWLAPVLPSIGNALAHRGLYDIFIPLENQNESHPPLSREAIKKIPTTVITQNQMDRSCSICLEDFRLNELVSKLSCDHFHHEKCIVPWLKLHGTCPVCRKNLSDEAVENNLSSLLPILRAADDAIGNNDSSSFSTATSSTPGSSSISSRYSHSNMNIEE